MRPVQSFPAPLKKVRRNRARSRLFWVIASLVVLFVGLGFLSHLPRIVIQEIEIYDTKVLDKEEVSSSIKEYLSGNVAILFAKGNIFLYSKNKIETFILEKFPRIYRVVEINRDGQRLDIVLEERQGVFTWCGYEAPPYIQRFEKRDCYFLDQTGFIFDESPFFTPGVYLTFYGGIKKDFPVIGQTLATQNSVNIFGDISVFLEKIGLPVHSVSIGDDNQNAFLLDIFTTTGDYAKIIFNEEAELSEVQSKINSMVIEKSFSEQFSDNGSLLEYIDTRFNNRVFYKFKEI